MENIQEGIELYKRLKTNCSCGCASHCGHSCLECDSCTECDCPECRAEQEKGSS